MNPGGALRRSTQIRTLLLAQRRRHSPVGFLVRVRSLKVRQRRRRQSEGAVSDAASSAVRTVSTIVPETRQNIASGANASQLDRSVKWKRVKDLRGKTTMAEMLIGV
jgi:hypothetical protein